MLPRLVIAFLPRSKHLLTSWLQLPSAENEDHGIQSHHFIANRWGNNGNGERLYFFGLQNHCRWWLQPWKLKVLAPWKKSYDQPRQHIKKQRHYFVNKGPSSQSCGFSSSHVWIWELDYKESWVPKNWSFWTVVLEKTLESPLDCKIKSVNPKGNQSWIFIRKTDAKAETPILWPPDVKNWLTAKDPDAGKDWRPEEKGMTEDEMVGWHHRLDGHEFELVSCSQSMESQRVGHDWATELNWIFKKLKLIGILLLLFVFSLFAWGR